MHVHERNAQSSVRGSADVSTFIHLIDIFYERVNWPYIFSDPCLSVIPLVQDSLSGICGKN